METVSDIEALFEQHHTRLVQSLGVAFGAEAAADAVRGLRVVVAIGI